MCLTATKKDISDFKEKHTDDDVIKVWKIYRKSRDYQSKSGYGLRGRYLNNSYTTIIGSILSQSGVVQSDRIQTSLLNLAADHDRWLPYAKCWSISRGIHVYTTREEAEDVFNWDGCHKDDYAIVCCHAQMKDFIAASNKKRAVFTKVTISPRNWRRAVKGN